MSKGAFAQLLTVALYLECVDFVMVLHTTGPQNLREFEILNIGVVTAN